MNRTLSGPTTTNMFDSGHTIHLIHGIDHDGKAFRPGDWAERLRDAVAAFHREHRGSVDMGYLAYISPFVEKDVKGLRIDSRLRDLTPVAYEFLFNFAKENGLLVTTKSLDIAAIAN